LCRRKLKKFIAGRAIRAPTFMIHWNIDDLTTDLVSGWAFSDQGPVEIAIRIDGQPITRAVIVGLPRPDVAAAYGNSTSATDAGFSYAFDAADFRGARGGEAVFDIEVTDGRSESRRHQLPVFRPLPALEAAMPASPAMAPLPREIVGVVRAASSDSAFSGGAWSDATTLGAFEVLERLVKRGSRRNPHLYAYLSYLHRCRSHTDFVYRNFPKLNLTTSASHKDYGCAGTVPTEIMAMAHYLYVIRSHGVSGSFAEFGCYKGFSTSCLSYVCGELGLSMQVFDSFEGLPASASSFYQAGDFAGSLEEVSQNVATFGNPRVVQYHRGFFSDSLPRWKQSPIACMWMDVDLDTSSADVMSIFGLLDPRSAIFSHECADKHFTDPVLAATPDPHNVIPPIMAAFAKHGRQPAGRHIHAYTGAFWDAQQAAPALPGAIVDQLCRTLLG
jgi:hypothetical protein